MPDNTTPMSPRRGLTPASVLAGLFGLFLVAWFVQFDIVQTNSGNFGPEHTVPTSAIMVFVVLSLGVWAFAAVTRYRLLSRPELLAVVYILLVGTPFMSQAFWHRFIYATTTLPRENDLLKLDLLDDRLWPVGDNLLASGWSSAAIGSFGVEVVGPGKVTFDFHKIEVEPGRRYRALTIEQDEPGQTTIVRFPLSLSGSNAPVLGERYRVTVQARAETLDGSVWPQASRYAMRLTHDNEPTFLSVMEGQGVTLPSVTQRESFALMGATSVRLTLPAREFLMVEFLLEGVGRVTFADPKLSSVEGMMALFEGQRIVPQSVYESLDPSQRGGLLVRPDHLLSLSGLMYLLRGNIAIESWARPVFWWGLFFGLVLLASLCLSVLMRRQWMESERFQMPMARIPQAVVGDPDDAGLLPRLYRNPMTWVGLACGLTWCLLRGWNYYNPSVPDTNILIPLEPYFKSPGWGQTWQGVTFTVSAVFLSLAVFMELSVTLSLVVGYLLFRMQFWAGEMTGLRVYSAYPFPEQQQTGAYLAYALAVLFLARKHLWVIASTVWRGGWREPRDEMIGYRAAVVLIAGCFGGAIAWAQTMGISPASMAAFFGYLLTIAFVAARLRNECGVPFSYLGLLNTTTVLTMLGGVALFGPAAMLVALIVAALVGQSPFMSIPGTQLEAAEVSRRYGLPPSHALGVIVIGVVGGLVIGGWVMLSSAYTRGADTMSYDWAFSPKPWAFFSLNQEMQQANAAMSGKAAVEKALDPSVYGYAFGGGVTLVLATLRQLFAGFWFHPIGFLLGMTYLAQITWGSCLLGWLLRVSVLKIGGAAAVRDRLQPFFVGVFLGAAVSTVIWMLVAARLTSMGIKQTYVAIP